MDDDDDDVVEILDPAEIGQLASTTFKTERERIGVMDEDGFTSEFIVEKQKTMTEGGEIISDKKVMLAKFLTCGDRVTDPRQIMRCVYEGHPVCHDCITRCDGCRTLVCLDHSDEYDFEGRILRLCDDCARMLEAYQKRESTIGRRAFRSIRGMFRREEI